MHDPYYWYCFKITKEKNCKLPFQEIFWNKKEWTDRVFFTLEGSISISQSLCLHVKFHSIPQTNKKLLDLTRFKFLPKINLNQCEPLKTTIFFLLGLFLVYWE